MGLTSTIKRAQRPHARARKFKSILVSVGAYVAVEELERVVRGLGDNERVNGDVKTL